MPGVAITPYEAADLDELVPMWRASFEHGVRIVDPHPLAQQKAYFLSEVLPATEVRVARLPGRIVGFIAARTDFVLQLFVHVDHLGQGIGTRLLDGAKQRSQGRLQLYTFQRNHGARAFYERSGFRVVKTGFEPVWQLDDVLYEWRREPGHEASAEAAGQACAGMPNVATDGSRD